MSHVRRSLRLGLIVLLALPLAGAGWDRASAAPSAPTVVLIVTDDQRWDTLWAMPYVRDTLTRVRFRNAFVVNPLCCPSRASILTGNYSHTTGVWDNAGPLGGFDAFPDGSTLATWFDAAGYRTAFVGKYLNNYADPNYTPPGWDRWAAFLGPGANGAYYDYELNVDGAVQRHGSGQVDYSTDVLAGHAVQAINSAPQGDPLFMYVAPYAPHAPSLPAARHTGFYSSTEFRRDQAFNELDLSDKPGYIRRQNPVDLRSEERARRWVAEALLAVDEMVADIVGALQDSGRFDDAIIAFTSDNGLATGEHRWTYKVVPYEPSIRVPLVLGGGGVPQAGSVRSMVANIDIAPTIADLAGLPIPATDGVSQRPAIEGTGVPRREVLIERSLYDRHAYVPAYCALRTPTSLYVHYETGFEELYSLRRDPNQLANRAVLDRFRGKVGRMRDRTRTLCSPLPPGMSSF